MNNENKKDYSIIFKEIEKLKDLNISQIEFTYDYDDYNHIESINEFSEICREINESNIQSSYYITFS